MNAVNLALYLSCAVLALAAGWCAFMEWSTWSRRRQLRRAHRGNRVTEYPPLCPCPVCKTERCKMCGFSGFLPPPRCSAPLTPADIALLAAMNEAFEGEPWMERERRG